LNREVYLPHLEPADGRKAINGLALLVEQTSGLNPFGPAIYARSCAMSFLKPSASGA